MKNPRTYIAHRSKVRLAKRFGQKDTDPLFKLPRLPRSEMDQLSQELEEFELPGKTNQEDVIDEIWNDVHKSHTGDDQDDSTASSYKASSNTKTSEDGMSNDNRSSDKFLSFHQSPGFVGSEASTPEQEFSRHFDVDDLEMEVLDQALRDSSVEEEPVSAASQLVPDPEPVFAESQHERLVPEHDLGPATVPEPEPEKQTDIPQEFGSESSSRRKSNRISKPVEKFDSAQNTEHNLKRTSKINYCKIPGSNPKECEEYYTRGLEGKTSDVDGAKSKEYFKREFGFDKNKGSIPGKTAHREYQK